MDDDEMAMIKVMVAELAGVVPYRQMVEEIGLAIAVQRRARQ